MAGKFELYEDKSGEYRFRLKAGNGEVIATSSESYKTKASALNQEFQTKVKPQIEAVAKEKGFDILLDSQVALTVSPEFDISTEVISRLDSAEPAAAAAAKPAAAAAPAAAKPAPKPTAKP